jgi:hypothetical protein
LAGANSINITAAGAGGLDTGAVAANTWYSLYVIYDSVGLLTSGVFSLDGVSPLMPGAYDKFRRVGYVRTKAAAVDILPFTQAEGDNWFYYNNFAGDVNLDTINLATDSDASFNNIYMPMASQPCKIGLYADDIICDQDKGWIWFEMNDLFASTGGERSPVFTNPSDDPDEYPYSAILMGWGGTNRAMTVTMHKVLGGDPPAPDYTGSVEIKPYAWYDNA